MNPVPTIPYFNFFGFEFPFFFWETKMLQLVDIIPSSGIREAPKINISATKCINIYIIEKTNIINVIFIEEMV